MSVTLSEEFNNPLGQFPNYDAYDPDQRLALRDLKHVDLMNRNPTWTGATAAVNPTYANFVISSIAISSGVTTTATLPLTNLDLSTFDPINDVISVALPTFPLGSVDQTQSFIDFTSGNGTFSTAVSIPFTSSTVALLNGNSELRFPISLLTGGAVNISSITRIRFRVRGTASATVRIMAIRALAQDWTLQAVDTNTSDGRLYRTAPLNGDINAPLPIEPIHWRATDLPGDQDPRPIDSEYGVVFNTGSLIGSNLFTLYMREVTEDFLTQLDLDGLTMGDLDGHAQPDLGQAAYTPRIQQDLEDLTQTTLQGRTQFDLERTPDYLSASWIQFVCQWQTDSAAVSIVDTEGNGYNITLDSPLVANQNYVFFATLEENFARATIYQVNVDGSIGTQVFDSTRIYDDTAFQRRAGRFGWYAFFQDGNAYLDSIRSRSLSFAEYRSLPFESNTPVIGAELFVSTSPSIEHYTNLAPGPNNQPTYSDVSRDTTRSTSGESWKITNYGNHTLQGIQTNEFLLTDFDNSEVHFDLFYPSDAVLGNHLLAASLRGNGLATIPLHLPIIIPDQWQHVRIPLSSFGQSVLSGDYSLVIWQLDAYQSTWWIDNISIFSRSIAWDGRAVVDDPWFSNDARWTPFRDNLNTDSGGVLFPSRGTQLQIRGRALRQDASISRIQFKPKYAELGRFVPGTAVATVPPVANFTTAFPSGHRVTFTSTSTDADGYVALCEWNFGDGAKAIGQIVDHTYPATGPYSVTLIAMDNNGNRSTSTTVVNVP